MTTPLYLEIKLALEMDILSGRIPPGQKLPPIRDLSEHHHANGNTIQRALAGLRETGLVTGSRGEALRTLADPEQITRRRQEKAAAIVRDYIRQLRALGYTGEEMKMLICVSV